MKKITFLLMRKKSLMLLWLFLVGMFHCVIAMERQTHYTEDQLKTKVLNDACEIKLTQLTFDYSEKSAGLSPVSRKVLMM